jgi:hypothetical protein
MQLCPILARWLFATLFEKQLFHFSLKNAIADIFLDQTKQSVKVIIVFV